MNLTLLKNVTSSAQSSMLVCKFWPMFRFFKSPNFLVVTCNIKKLCTVAMFWMNNYNISYKAYKLWCNHKETTVFVLMLYVKYTNIDGFCRDSCEMYGFEHICKYICTVVWTNSICLVASWWFINNDPHSLMVWGSWCYRKKESNQLV